MTRYYFLPKTAGGMEKMDTSKFRSMSAHQHTLGTLVRVEADWSIHAELEKITGIVKFGNMFRSAAVYPQAVLNLVYGLGVTPPAGEMVVDMVNTLGKALFGAAWSEIHLED